jgi:hypothetical protein
MAYICSNGAVDVVVIAFNANFGGGKMVDD